MLFFIRLLLWDVDSRSYSYYIQSSVNGWDWEEVVDKIRKSCQSWQVVEFSPRVVVYFKIVEVFNSAYEAFHCVHFECPASTLQASHSDSSSDCSTSISSAPATGVDDKMPASTGTQFQNSLTMDDNLRQSEFELMAESNCSPGIQSCVL